MKAPLAQDNYDDAKPSEELGIQQTLNFEQILMRSIANINYMASHRTDGMEMQYRSAVANLKASLEHWFDAEFKNKLDEIETEMKNKLLGNVFKKAWQQKIKDNRGSLRAVFTTDKIKFQQEVRDDETSTYYDRMYEEIMKMMARKGMLLKRSLSVEA